MPGSAGPASSTCSRARGRSRPLSSPAASPSPRWPFASISPSWRPTGWSGSRSRRSGVGRPARIWHLTGAASGQVPRQPRRAGGRHAGRPAQGVRPRRARATDRRAYEGAGEALPRADSRQAPRWARRSPRLAAVRRDEGYMAESSRKSDGSLLLIENHCPICEAAQACQGLCAGELNLFRIGARPRGEDRAHGAPARRRAPLRLPDYFFVRVGFAAPFGRALRDLTARGTGEGPSASG